MALLGMDEASGMAATYMATWGNVVKNPVVTEVKEIRFWKRIVDDDEASDFDPALAYQDFDPVLAYQVSGRFEWTEGEGYNRFMFIVERESKRIRGFAIQGGAKLSVLNEVQEK